MAGRIRRHWKGLLASAVVLAVVLVVGVPFVYINFVEGTQPAPLSLSDAEPASVTLSTTGKLTLHGTTKEVTFPIAVQRSGTGLAATGTIDIAYHDYGIDNPSVGGFVSVGDSGTIECLLVAARA